MPRAAALPRPAGTAAGGRVPDDPAGGDADAVRPIRDEIARRVRELLTELLPAATP